MRLLLDSQEEHEESTIIVESCCSNSEMIISINNSRSRGLRPVVTKVTGTVSPDRTSGVGFNAFSRSFRIDSTSSL